MEVKRCPNCGEEIIPDFNKSSFKTEGNYKKYIHPCHKCGYEIVLSILKVHQRVILPVRALKELSLGGN